MLWRLFPDGCGRSGRSRDAAATGYWTVMTWFPTGFGAASATPSTPPILQPAAGTYRYLHGTLGFESSLTGQPLAE